MDADATTPASQPPASNGPLELLRTGELLIEGRLVDASNTTLYCSVERGGARAICIYKPRAGERPLWDFPTGTLSRREVAAYEVSEALGWQIVPPTVWRDGPLGVGMVQQWIDVDDTVDLVDLVRSDRQDLRRMAVFDVIINNADRKGGHILPTPEGRLYGIDHGVAFAVEDKVRTLLWQWEGDPIPAEVLADLGRLKESVSGGSLRTALRSLLSKAEVSALSRRVVRLLDSARHPGPSPDWPAIPWPPF